ncbi:MAG: hypothetical protein F4Z29_09935 [Gemmatimonadetes bacterium]|nr:hypothetical protein [Gemmatimonadota bacterium]
MLHLVTNTVCLLAAVAVLTAACSDNPMTSNPAEPRARPAVASQDNVLALLNLSQGFNDLDRYIVTGTIKNVSQAAITEYITIRVRIKNASGVELDTEVSTLYSDLLPQAEVTFETASWRFELDRDTPDPSKTVVELLIDGNQVVYRDLTQAPYYHQFDFRFSNWGDDEATVQSNEPDSLVMNHIDGGKATKESEGYATATLEFSDTVIDTVTVIYAFRGGALWLGAYDFDQSVPDSKRAFVATYLSDRYGTATTDDDGTRQWTKNDRTVVFLFAANDWRGIRIAYIDVNAQLDTDAEDDYNRLPLRVVVPE